MIPEVQLYQPLLAFHDDPLRRQLNSALMELQSIFDTYTYPKHDKLTIDLISWLDCFKKDLKKNADTGATKKKYLDKLQNLLKEPICGYPLTKESYLGSDGYTYEKKSLLLYLKAWGTNCYHYPSPTNFKDTGPFTVVSHKLALVMLEWLKEQNGDIKDEDIIFEYEMMIQEYDKMVTDKKTPYFPTELNEKMRIMREKLSLQNEKTKFNEKLIEFGLLLDNTSFTDQTTMSLKIWHKLFTEKLEIDPDFNETKKECFIFLMDLLKDPITFTPLEEEAYLGSDGLTYSKKSLTIYINEIQEPYCYRSPKFPQNKDFFTVMPHPVVSEIVKWLKSNNTFTATDEIDKIYEIIIQKDNFKQLPTDENIYLERLANENLADKETLAANLEAFKSQAITRLKAIAKNGIDEVEEKIDADGVEIKELLQDADNIDARELQNILEAIEILKSQEEELKSRANNVNSSQVRIDGKIVVGYQRLNEVNAAISEAKAAIKNRDSGWLESLVTMVAIIAVSYFLPQMMSITATGGRYMLGFTAVF